MISEDEILHLLDGLGIEYEKIEHPAVFTADEACALYLPHPEAYAKNLLLTDDKKRAYYLLTVRASLPVDLKALRTQIGSRRLSLAPEESVRDLLGVAPGSVGPLALLNDESHTVKLLVDDHFATTLIGVHPNRNTATLFLQTHSLINLLEREGAEIRFVR